jgi:hypothetical protein
VAWRVLLGVVAALLATWAALVVFLFVVKPRGSLVQEALRIMPAALVAAELSAR